MAGSVESAGLGDALWAHAADCAVKQRMAKTAVAVRLTAIDERGRSWPEWDLCRRIGLIT
jgi:type IV secretory pathway protease TraF